MGICCTGPQLINNGELFIDKVLTNQNFYLKNLTFNDINNKFQNTTDKSDEEELLEKTIYPLTLKNDKSNEYLILHKGIISELISHINHKPIDKNDILFAFFPFMKHDILEKSDQILFKIFETYNKNAMNFMQFKDLLNLFIENTTSTLTFAMWNYIPKNEITLKESYDDMSSTIYTILHREMIVNKITEKISKELDEESYISMDIFIECIKKYKFENYRVIRDIFRKEFEEM